MGKIKIRIKMLIEKLRKRHSFHVTFMNLVFRMATNPRQYIKRGSYVLFKFFVDGEALSEVTKNLQQER